MPRRQVGDLLLEQLPQALGHIQGKGVKLLLHGPAPIVGVQHTPINERLHQSNQKQRLAVGPLVQPRRQRDRELLPGKARRKIRRYRFDAQ